MSSRQKPLPYVLYHSPCIDGFGAAYAAWKYFGDSARYVPLNYTDKLPDLREGADIFMVDLSFKRPIMLELAKKHPQIRVIDHHKTAEAELKDIEREASNIHVFFDMEHSGCYLTWYYFHASGTLPKLLRNIEDRDLWRHALPGTRRITAALAIEPQTFEGWDILCTDDEAYKNLIRSGDAMLRQQQHFVSELTKEVRTAVFTAGGDTYWVPAVNAPYFLGSDLGHKLLDLFPLAPFAAVYRDTGSGRRDWSLRSEEGRIDVSHVASLNGGGGHRNAAGMSEVSAYNRVAFSRQSYEEYLGGTR